MKVSITFSRRPFCFILMQPVLFWNIRSHGEGKEGRIEGNLGGRKGISEGLLMGNATIWVPSWAEDRTSCSSRGLGQSSLVPQCSKSLLASSFLPEALAMLCQMKW